MNLRKEGRKFPARPDRIVGYGLRLKFEDHDSAHASSGGRKKLNAKEDGVTIFKERSIATSGRSIEIEITRENVVQLKW